jgi:hypothetical protein
MARFNVTFMLDADDLDAAQELVSTWTVTPGTTLFGLVQLASIAGPPVPIGPSGSVGTALATAAATPPLPPPPRTPAA